MSDKSTNVGIGDWYPPDMHFEGKWSLSGATGEFIDVESKA
jgi:hypothetical protein